MASTSIELSNTASSVNDIVSNFVDLAGSMSTTIALSAQKSFIQTVKLDHLVWKTDVYRAFWGKSDQIAQDFADHTQCRLGKWYYQGEGRRDWSQLKSFQMLEEPHKRVHESGIAALHETDNKNFPEAMHCLKAMEAASDNVLSLLTGMDAEIERNTSQQSLALASSHDGDSVTMF